MVKKTVNQRSGTTSCNHSSASIIEGTTKNPCRSTLRIGEVACLEMKMIGKPYAGELHVRFDEGEQDCVSWRILHGRLQRYVGVRREFGSLVSGGSLLFAVADFF